jgi:hypothetical protein
MEHRRTNLRYDGKPPGNKRFFHRNIGIIYFNAFKKCFMEWLKNNFKQAVLITFLTVFLSTIGSIIVFTFSNKETRLQGAASVEYVDKKDVDLKLYIDTKDDNITLRMDRIQAIQNTKADKDDFDKVYQKCEENNKLLIEVLMKINTMK